MASSSVGKRKAGPSKPCLETALDILGRRACFERDLAERLAKRNFPPEEINHALCRLKEVGYLDDKRLTIERVRTSAERWGRARILRELTRRGASESEVTEALDRWEAETSRAGGPNWQERARAALEKRFGGKTPSEKQLADPNFPRKERERRLRFLLGRGFSMEEALAAVADLESYLG